MRDTVLMDAAAMRRTLDRLAATLLRRFKAAPALGLIGIRARGDVLAKRLQKALESKQKARIPVGALDISVYRDDFDALQDEIKVKGSEIDFDVRGRHIVLVDDVLYTGRSVRAAMDAVVALGRPASISLVVLVDRGHREMPIQADAVGRVVKTGRGEQIQVQVTEVDGVDRVVIRRPPGAAPSGRRPAP
jgi:pyrimidine operon attenuation protein / uracil phosphoribosyltransferase